ncbi:transposase family protein [Stenotrophomonas rhizophila]|nr:transposase family protein [Stenotrophomonas rhizophila]
MFTGRDDTHLVSSYGLQWEFTMPYCPQPNGMDERVIQALKE